MGRIIATPISLCFECRTVIRREQGQKGPLPQLCLDCRTVASAPVEVICACGKPIVREPGRRGRLPSKCYECKPPKLLPPVMVEAVCAYSKCGKTSRVRLYTSSTGRRYCNKKCRMAGASELRQNDPARWNAYNEARRVTALHLCVEGCGREIWQGDRCGPCGTILRGYGRAYSEPERQGVFIRDAWICQLCGEECPSSLKVPELLAPTIDHIVPHAVFRNDPTFVDGPHNWQTAHYSCNCKKGARSMQQWLADRGAGLVA